MRPWAASSSAARSSASGSWRKNSHTAGAPGGSGPNDSETYSNLMNNTIGTRFRIVSGYKANSNVMLAMERWLCAFSSQRIWFVSGS